MRRGKFSWTQMLRRLARRLGWAVAAGSIAVALSMPASAQRGRDGGGRGGGPQGAGGARMGGGQMRAAPSAGAAVRAPNPAPRATTSPTTPAVADRMATRPSNVPRPAAPAIQGNTPAAAPQVVVPRSAAPATGSAAVRPQPSDRPTFGPRELSGTTASATPRTTWYSFDPVRGQAFNSNFATAWQSRLAANAAASALGINPRWSTWGGTVRNGNFFYGGGGYPYFNSGFWTGRNLVGLGLGSYAIGYGAPGLGGGWWGYSPWVSNQPWNYWYGNPGWSYFANTYGWNQPYYYDYGPSGTVVYRGNQVLVNDQPVGSAADYAQSAAALAAVTPEEMNAPHDWMPLGTFSMAVSQTETNPSRILQLAFDNKHNLISGTVYNRQSNNLYTVQGRVDPKTQRVAFTMGKDSNVVMETGLYNLTQQETPLLAHFGPTQTQTYLLVRLPEPESTDQPPRTATSPQPPTAPPAADLRR